MIRELMLVAVCMVVDVAGGETRRRLALRGVQFRDCGGVERVEWLMTHCAIT